MGFEHEIGVQGGARISWLQGNSMLPCMKGRGSWQGWTVIASVVRM